MFPVGTQSATVVAHHYRAAHVAIEATLGAFRNAAVLELADRYLGDLSDAVVKRLQLNTPARRVLISAEGQRHAIEQRKIASEADVELVALRLTEAVANIRYQLLPQTDPRIFKLVGYAQSVDRCLLLPLKLVSAADAETGQDEWWVPTAFPYGWKNFRKNKASLLLI